MPASTRSPLCKQFAASIFSASVISRGLGHSSLISMTASFIRVGLPGQFAAVMIAQRRFPPPRGDRDSDSAGGDFRAPGMASAILLHLRQVFPGDHTCQQAQAFPDAAVTL